jgi:hypothetical protein
MKMNFKLTAAVAVWRFMGAGRRADGELNIFNWGDYQHGHDQGSSTKVR